jgi:hypothetical protein
MGGTRAAILDPHLFDIRDSQVAATFGPRDIKIRSQSYSNNNANYAQSQSSRASGPSMARLPAAAKAAARSQRPRRYRRSVKNFDRSQISGRISKISWRDLQCFPDARHEDLKK